MESKSLSKIKTENVVLRFLLTIPEATWLNVDGLGVTWLRSNNAPSFPQLERDR